MNAYWGVVISAVGLLVSALSFLAGRKSVVKDEGKHEGQVLTKLDSINESVGEIKSQLTDMKIEIGEQRDRLTKLETKMEMYHHKEENK